MKSESTQIRRQFQQKLWVWLLLISAGVLAYGVGLYQGSQYRMSRMVASVAKPVAVEIAPAAVMPVGPKPVELSGSPGNTGSPKSHSKSR